MSKNSAAEQYLQQIGGINERIRQLKREKLDMLKVLRFKIRQRRELLEALENVLEAARKRRA